VVQTFQVRALAFPVTDGVADEFECGDTPKIRDREDRVKNRLQTGIVPLFGKHVHLKEALVGVLLDFNQIGYLDCGFDLGKIGTLARCN
jgi:hypothetical protein